MQGGTHEGVTPSYLCLSRHHVFRFRRRVPDDLRDRFRGDELRCSLGTKSKGEAVRIARMLAMKTDILFERLRNMASNKDLEDDAIRMDLIMKADLSDLRLGKFEIEYDPTKPGEQQEADRQIERIQAMAKAAMPTPAAPSPRSLGPTLSGMVEEFLSDGETRRRQDKAATVRKDKDALALFQQVVDGDTPINQVSQIHANEFAGLLESRGLAANTMNNHMGAVSKFSNWVHGRHPHAGHSKLDFSTLRFKVDKRPNAQRDAFTIEEVKQILQNERLHGLSFACQTPLGCVTVLRK